VTQAAAGLFKKTLTDSPKAGVVKKSATENSQLNKKQSYRNIGRYSGSFSPPGDNNDVRLVYDITTIKEMEGGGSDNFGRSCTPTSVSTPTRGIVGDQERKLVSGIRSCMINDSRDLRTSLARDRLFTPQLTRREPPPLLARQRYDSPILGGSKRNNSTPISHLQNCSELAAANFSSPKSERGFVLRREKELLTSIANSPARSEIVSGMNRAPQNMNHVRRSYELASNVSNSPYVTPILSAKNSYHQENVPHTDNIYAQPIRPQSSLGPRSLTLLELTNKRNDSADDSWNKRDENQGHPLDQTYVGVNLVGGQAREANERIVKKGLMWVQQDKLFSRWKERFIVLTPEYLQFFKKSTSKISEMGNFIFKMRLSDISSNSLEDRRGYLTIAVVSKREGKLLLRRTEGIKEWQKILENQMRTNREQLERRLMMNSDQFWTRKQKSDSHDIHHWLMSRNKIGQQFSYMTPPPSNKRTSPQDQQHLPVYYCDLQTNNRISPKPKYFDSPSPPKPQFSYFNSPCSPPPPPCPGPPNTMASNLEDDSGFESLVTNVSDSGSVSSRLVSSPANKELIIPSEYLPEYNLSSVYQNVAPAPVPILRSKDVFKSQDKYFIRTESRSSSRAGVVTNVRKNVEREMKLNK